MNATIEAASTKLRYCFLSLAFLLQKLQIIFGRFFFRKQAICSLNHIVTLQLTACTVVPYLDFKETQSRRKLHIFIFRAQCVATDDTCRHRRFQVLLEISVLPKTVTCQHNLFFVLSNSNSHSTSVTVLKE